METSPFMPGFLMQTSFPLCSEVIARFGSLKRAFALVRRVTGARTWDAIRQRRIEDLLVFLALVRFRKRPKLSGYPKVLQRDFRASLEPT